MQQLIPNAKAQFIDSGGQPLASGTVGFYFPGTLNPKPTYQDAAGTIANTNPVNLDSRGQALIWGSGVYRQIVKDASGVTIWDQITEDANSGLTGNITDAVFTAGDGTGNTFIPGTTAQLTLPAAPGVISNTWIFFDGVYQADDQIASLNGVTVMFNSPIPVGVSEVTVKIGTTIAVGTPGNGTVTDASIASGTKLYNRIRDTVDVKDFGAKGDGITDDTAAMQLAHNTGRLVYYPAGTYLFSKTINIAAGGIVGDGIGQAVLQFNDTTSIDAINWTGSGSGIGPWIPMFHDFTINGTLAKTAGNAITVSNASVSTGFADFSNVTIENMPTAFNLLTASYWKMRGCNVINYLNYAVNIANNIVNDQGDSSISDCVFNTALTTGGVLQAINYQSSGGLKVTNTKILGGLSGLVLGYTGTSSSSDLLVSNCSIEVGPGNGSNSFGVNISRVSGAASFSRILITGNEIAGGTAVVVGMNGITGFVGNVVISGNDLIAASNTGWALLMQGVSSFAIGENMIEGAGQAGTVGVLIDANCTNGNVAPQTYGAIAAANRMQNSSVSTYVRGYEQRGTTSGIVCSSAYGALFEGSTTVNFTFPFAVAPNPQDIKCAPHDTLSGGVSAFAVNPTTTGFTMVAIGATSGGAVQCNWQAEGII